jgi:4-amino-4-deoxy-L-arabinose transferase-like glycosyltransferase
LKKLPSPTQGWQTYQPPLYYIINQLFSPASENHVLLVRLLSVFYGAVFLGCCHIVMKHWGIPNLIHLLILVYFMSIPAFVHLFTTYNNDALVMALSAAIIAALVKYYFRPKPYMLVLLFLLAALGVYTKYNIILLIFSIGILLCGAFILRAIPFKKAVIILLPLVLGILTIVPYLRFHNFHHTGKYLVQNIESDAWPYWNISQQVGFARFFFTPPAITNGEYTYPYAFDEKYGVIYNWTKRTYLSSIISTSLFGEFNYSRKAPGADKWAWITLWIYVVLLANIAYVRRPVRLMSWFLVLTLFTHGLFIRFFFPFYINANYRFFAWITIPLAVLTAAEFNRSFKEKNKKYLMLATLLIIGSLAHIIFINVLNHELSLFLKINATVK